MTPYNCRTVAVGYNPILNVPTRAVERDPGGGVAVDVLFPKSSARALRNTLTANARAEV